MALASLQGFAQAGLTAHAVQFHQLVDQRKMANVVTLVARHGKVVSLDSYGVMDVSAVPTVSVRNDTIYRLASMTKPITGAAMMMLYEEGKWKLDDPVEKHIPEFKDLKVSARGGSPPVEQIKKMTMAQLMSHSAGFGGSGDYKGVNLRKGNLKDMIDEIAKFSLFFQPGKEWRYGPSVDIQGYLIEKWSGIDLSDFFHQRIFTPLGMTDTGFFIPTDKQPRVVRLHGWTPNGTVTVAGTPNNPVPTAKPKFLSGSGGLSGTALDYWRFSQMILNRGQLDGRRLLHPETVALVDRNVLEPGVRVLGRPGLGFGLDYAITLDPEVAKTAQPKGSFWWGGAFATWFWIDPVNDLVVIGLVQNSGAAPKGAGPDDLREMSAEAVYKALGKNARRL